MAFAVDGHPDRPLVRFHMVSRRGTVAENRVPDYRDSIAAQYGDYLEVSCAPSGEVAPLADKLTTVTVLAPNFNVG